mgnify:FL=1
MQGLRGEMDRLESALLKHTIKSTVHTSESEYRGSRVYPKSAISQINRGSLIHLTTETYQLIQDRGASLLRIYLTTERAKRVALILCFSKKPWDGELFFGYGLLFARRYCILYMLFF